MMLDDELLALGILFHGQHLVLFVVLGEQPELPLLLLLPQMHLGVVVLLDQDLHLSRLLLLQFLLQGLSLLEGIVQEIHLLVVCV